ncbi:hypothetical protein JCM6882_001320 [Rhodosporidiobolus microsporus]
MEGGEVNNSAGASPAPEAEGTAHPACEIYSIYVTGVARPFVMDNVRGLSFAESEASKEGKALGGEEDSAAWSDLKDGWMSRKKRLQGAGGVLESTNDLVRDVLTHLLSSSITHHTLVLDLRPANNYKSLSLVLLFVLFLVMARACYHDLKGKGLFERGGKRAAMHGAGGPEEEKGAGGEAAVSPSLKTPAAKEEHDSESKE